MSSWDLFTAVTRRPDQLIGVCVILTVVLLLLALVLGSPIPMYVAAVPVAVAGIARIATSDRHE